MTTVMFAIAFVVLGFVIWTTIWPQSGSQIDPADPASGGRAGNKGAAKGTGEVGDEDDGMRGGARREEDPATLRQRALSDRKAAVKYRDQIMQKLQALEATAEPTGANLSEFERREAREALAVQRAEVRRELEWVESRVHALSK